MNNFEIDMNENQLTLALSGQIDTQSVRNLASEIRLGFDYYKFSEVTVTLDSPGGEYIAMHSLLEIINKRKAKNCSVHIRAGRQCASAAALLLAHGKWGTRSVEPTTHLLFHWARASFKEGLTLTSGGAANLAHGLSTIDQRVLEQLVDCLCAGAGNTGMLMAEVQSRLDALLQDWDEVARALPTEDGVRAPKQVEWVRDLQRNLKRWQAEPKSTKQKAALVSALKARFEKDTAMDLREAYALCLIDSVNEVLPRNRCASATAELQGNEDGQHLKPSPRH
jgi:ATP-dependent protease ClpP protease subunit